MSALADVILAELQRHEEVVGPYFNIRCKCGYIEKTVSRLGDFERHVSEKLASALSAAGLVTAAAEAAATPEIQP